ncbi:uncharacterized protein LOC142098476 [Mixophyes fleayi]|uniref:uncharacterized protein LOC142098476 n=1 Tax=Mixophyes fleayi TaxID=3061075 RepID=UPI003F4D9DF0
MKIHILILCYILPIDVCSSLYTDSESYLKEIYFNFTDYATLYELNLFYSEFDAYEVLKEFTGEQLGNLFINTTAVQDEMEAVQIFVEVEKRDFEEVTAFITEINTVASEKNIENLPDANIESLLAKTVWDKVSSEIDTAEEYKAWFEDKLSLVISSIPITDINSMDENIDCDSQSSVVQGFSKAFGKLSDDQKSCVYGRIKGYNLKVKGEKGSACGTDTGSSSDWIETYYGSFSGLATLTDFEEANSNFNAAEALDTFSGTQIADYVVQNGILKDESAIATVFESITSTKEVQDFLEQLNTEAPEDLQNSPGVDLIVADTFDIISKDFNSFQVEDWKQWTQVTLENVLFAVNSTELEKIPFPLPCASYQEVVKGFNNVFDSMKKETKQVVYTGCMKHQLTSTVSHTGVQCGDKTERTQNWLDKNLGQFAQFADITDLVKWNDNFQTTDVINTLSSTQLAEVAIDQMNNEEVACQIAGRLQQFKIDDIYTFYDTFYAAYTQVQ